LQDGLLPFERQRFDALGQRLPPGIAHQVRPDQPVGLLPLGVFMGDGEQVVADGAGAKANVLRQLLLFLRGGWALSPRQS